MVSCCSRDFQKKLWKTHSAFYPMFSAVETVARKNSFGGCIARRKLFETARWNNKKPGSCKLPEHLLALLGLQRFDKYAWHAHRTKRRRRKAVRNKSIKIRVFSYVKTPEKRTRRYPNQKHPRTNPLQKLELVPLFVDLHHECPSSFIEASGASSDQVFSECCKTKQVAIG